MVFLGGRSTLSRRDALLLLVGATCMHIFTTIFPLSGGPTTESIIINTHVHHDSSVDTEPLPPPPEKVVQQTPLRGSDTIHISDSDSRSTHGTHSKPQHRLQPQPQSFLPTSEFPHTSILHHAPGWTIFRNLYMSNGTLYILSPEDPLIRSKFPEFRMMTSTGKQAEPGNEQEREPTEMDMGFISPTEARKRWGSEKTKKSRVVVVEGSTALFNDPPQFLQHYYHLVAELFFGLQAFWHSAWAKPLEWYESEEFVSWSKDPSSPYFSFAGDDDYYNSENDTTFPPPGGWGWKTGSSWAPYDPSYNPFDHWNSVPLRADDYLPASSIPPFNPSSASNTHPALPPISHPQSFIRTHPETAPKLDRGIFIHAPKDGWRDGPEFDAYFLRGVFPGMTLETEEDWRDRARSSGVNKAYLFPLSILVDRSASFRGTMCGSRSQRTAAEAWEYMRARGLLRGERVGGWWEPVRERMWAWAGVKDEEEDVKDVKDVREDGNLIKLREFVEETKTKTKVETKEKGKQETSLVLAKTPYTLTPTLTLPLPKKIVITYLSRQPSPKRKLDPESHDSLVTSLQSLVARRNRNRQTLPTGELEPEWEFILLTPESPSHKPKDAQIAILARTTIFISVHGNGLTHLLWMKPTRVSSVVEIFYPGGFAHDYHWTTRALGMEWFGVWGGDGRRSEPGEGGRGELRGKGKVLKYGEEPSVDYPDGFQKDYIPVDGEVVARLVEERVDGGLRVGV